MKYLFKRESTYLQEKDLKRNVKVICLENLERATSVFKQVVTRRYSGLILNILTFELIK